ncbi:MAG TPA: response regulator [Longimicrobium sp.]|nr:response regulator [Longimicrobium sp.]
MRLNTRRITPETERPARPGASTVMLVEPDPQARDIAALLMRYYGYEVFCVAGFTEAMQLARAVRPDGIVTERLENPGGAGTIADALRWDAATRSIPVLVLTYAEGSGPEGKHHGGPAAAVLSKPVNGEELLRALIRHVGEPVLAPAAPAA